MAQKSFKPQNLKGILVFILILVLVGGGALFYFGLKEVRTFAIEVSHSSSDAEASGQQIQALQALKGQLAESEALVAKANMLLASPETYQTQALSDVRTYAAASGITIEKIDFSEVTPGVDRGMVVALAEPVSYAKLIIFLDAIEGNIPKMQVTSLSLSHLSGGSADSVEVGDINITIATR